jgi:hypothetical protein
MDPTFELIKECIAILKADTGIQAIVANKIYDRVPENQDGTPNVSSPYISLGNTNFLTEDFDCVDAATISVQFNCWSWGNGEEYSSALVRKLAFLVRKALHKREINLVNNAFVAIEHQITAYNRASDGVTHQASVNFETLIDII